MPEFAVERLKVPSGCVHSINRTKFANGWYVRAIFKQPFHSQGAICESATYFEDADGSWNSEEIEWMKLKREPNGGIYYCEVPGGWLLLATAKGETRSTEDDFLMDTRFGSLVFVPDKDHTSKFDQIPEKP